MPQFTIGQRATRLQARLVNIRLGTGALRLPHNVKRVHLRFAPHINGGHQGPRKFWRNELIRLKYHNPAVPMSVDNKAPQEENAIMSIHFAPEGSKQTSNSATSSAAAVDSTTSSSTPSDAASTTRVETLNMTNYTNAEILEAFITLTKATPIEPDPEDLQELAEVEAERRRHNQEAARGAEIRQRKKREQELLEQARGMIA